MTEDGNQKRAYRKALRRMQAATNVRAPKGDTTLGPKKQMLREAQASDALRMWLSGRFTYQDIADHFGFSKGTAANRVHEGLQAYYPHELVDEYRAIQAVEWDLIRRPLRHVLLTWQPIYADDHPAEMRYTLDDCIKVGREILRVQDQEARTLGLYKAPSPNELVWDMPFDEVEAHVLMIQEEERERQEKVKAAAAEAGIVMSDVDFAATAPA